MPIADRIDSVALFSRMQFHHRTDSRRLSGLRWTFAAPSNDDRGHRARRGDQRGAAYGRADPAIREHEMIPSNAAERLQQAFEQCRDMEAPLKDRLSAYAAVSREVLPAYGEAVDRLVARIAQNGGGENSPRPGDPMPPFVLPDETGRLLSLRSLLAHGPVAVMFHRGHWCPYCRLNVNALVRAQRDIAAVGGQVVIVTPERQQFARQFKASADAPFPVLTDIDNGYALLLNLAIWLSPDLQKLLSGRNLPSFHGNDAWMLPIPATFVVGRDGIVTARYVDPDFRRRMDIDDLIAALAGSP